jgi:hypothetical protein
LWVNAHDFDADFRGWVPSLRDWIEAKCELTDLEKIALKSIEDKPYTKRTQAEWEVAKQLVRKRLDCKSKLNLSCAKMLGIDDARKPCKLS